MKIPKWLPVYGSLDYRGQCPVESVEQVTVFNYLRRMYPDTFGRIAVHPRNEGKRNHRQTAKQKAEGMTPGASDVLIPGAPSFVCELKRKDHTKSQWQPNQLEYLKAAQDAGAFVCVAFGCEAFVRALNDWIKVQ